MIHRFQSKNAPPVIMLDDLAHRIFDVIKRPFENKGIFLLEQIPIYIERLEVAIEAERINTSKSTHINQKNQSTPAQDPLARRAYPFLELLREALKNGEPIVWGANY